MTLDARSLVGTHDILLVTLDTLRYDVAQQALERGATPGFAALLKDGWERRHTPGSFTYSAHHAFFAGFLPTPARPGDHPRLFAAAFDGSVTTTEHTCVLDAADLPTGLANRGYHTICIGGVGFFDKRTPLGSVLPAMFRESHWSTDLGVTHPRSTENQVALAIRRVDAVPGDQRVLLFVNVSALHQPNCIFSGGTTDSPETMAAALAYVDRHIPRLIAHMRRRAPLLCILTSDHGTAYGEDGHTGHRRAHPVVWDVPYAELVL